MVLTAAALFWFLAGVVLFLLELSMPAFVLFFFALGAWLTAILAWLYNLSLNGQVLSFILASLVSLLALRRLIRRAFTGGRAEENERDHPGAEPGARVVVVAPIVPPQEGRIKYGGSTWRAVCQQPIEAGEVAEIVAQDGLVITVRPVDNDGE
ncbi:MAG: NfeD family protein [Desulfopila sp.]